TKGFDFAQITSGGIPLEEINDYQSKYIDNLYICGEILDRQFPCGGFNLDFAWQSGIKTANRIVKKRNDTN
ncbi:MAG: NAD(P)/FAD-dependent oxidoreductase, partial [Eubacterium sp.]|nr:NAD(P)/FAD-dependent oxidoreductase [Eubacterium sp.]